MMSTVEARKDDALLLVQAITPTLSPTLSPGVHITQGTPWEWRTLANFSVGFLSLDSLKDLANDARPRLDVLFSREAAATIYLLACAPILMGRHPAGVHSLIRTGYLVWMDARTPLEILAELFHSVPAFVREVLHAASIMTEAEAIGELGGIGGNAWPLADGPIFRRGKRAVCIDFAAATRSLNSTLEFPPIQGRFANVRGAHFERQVQTLLNHSQWTPSPQMLALRRLTLTHNGRNLTDIDAIGESGSALLLVSCKSFVYAGQHDIGDYASIRNVASDCRKYASEWRAKVEYFQRHPLGDNYDFRFADRFIGGRIQV